MLFQRRISRKAGCLSAVFPTLRQFLNYQAIFLRNFRPGQGIRPQQYRTIQKRNLLLATAAGNSIGGASGTGRGKYGNAAGRTGRIGAVRGTARELV